uniref:Uncharacterized protein n=1 Tax=Arundo donax TaxID=35708 RepID=A0A0A8Z616_ARUDO
MSNAIVFFSFLFENFCAHFFEMLVPTLLSSPLSFFFKNKDWSPLSFVFIYLLCKRLGPLSEGQKSMPIAVQVCHEPLTWL